jgi:ribosome maturation factor RimP
MTEQGRGNVADAVRQVVGPVVTDAGLWLEDVEVSRAGARSVVRITVDLPEDAIGSLDSDTLGEASREISAALDTDDVVPGVYTLEISTPGTSRPLTQPRHFRRARTRLVTLRLADGGAVTGRLTDVVEDGDGLVLVLEDGARVPLGQVRKGKVEVELKRLEDDSDEAAGDAAADDAGETRTQEG